MVITKKHLSRRTVLRGVGAAIALPLLDGMVPALTAQSKTAAAPIRRLAIFYPPNGMAMGYWLPKAEGVLDGQLPPTLRSLDGYRDRLTIVSGLDHTTAAKAKQGGDHSKSCGCFLTAVTYDARSDSEVVAGVSVDQVAARKLSEATQLTSLELTMDSASILGRCNNAACSLSNTISWRTERVPNQPESDPRAIFERLFGTTQSTDAAARLTRIERDRSVLDFVGGALASLNRRLGTADQVKLGEYLDSVRDVERRLQKATEQNARELPVVDQPMGIPRNYGDHAHLMMDLLSLAYQTDLTRVATFMYGGEVSSRAYPEVGVSDSHHPLSHHQNDPAKLERLHKINEFHMQQFAYLVGKLSATTEGNGTLLDGSVLIYGTGISDSNTHLYDDVPIAVVTGAAIGVKGGRHIRHEKGTRLANLWVTALNLMGVATEKFGDSTGTVSLLA
jgi:hypothetical protein